MTSHVPDAHAGIAHEHVDAESLGMYLEGRGSSGERERIEEHLSHCDDCYDLFADSLRLLQPMAAESTVARRRPEADRQPRQFLWFRVPERGGWFWFAGACATAAAIVVAVFVAQRSTPGSGELPVEYRALMASLEGDRPSIGRLAGSARYGPAAILFRSNRRTVRPTVAAAAAQVLQATERNSSAAALRATGGSFLVLGDMDRAVDALQRAAAAAPDDPDIQIDLSAAYLERARRAGDAHPDSERAWRASARAYELAPQSPAALFNLALSLEQLARTADAERAWRQYLDLDPDSDWAREARRHLERIAPR